MIATVALIRESTPKILGSAVYSKEDLSDFVNYLNHIKQNGEFDYNLDELILIAKKLWECETFSFMDCFRLKIYKDSCLLYITIDCQLEFRKE